MKHPSRDLGLILGIDAILAPFVATRFTNEAVGQDVQQLVGDHIVTTEFMKKGWFGRLARHRQKHNILSLLEQPLGMEMAAGAGAV